MPPDVVRARCAPILAAVRTQDISGFWQQELARQLARALDIDDSLVTEHVGDWMARQWGAAVSDGFAQLRVGLEAAGHRVIHERPNRTYEPFYDLLSIVAVRDEQGQSLYASWSELQRRVWDLFAQDNMDQAWAEVAALAGSQGTPIPLRNRALALDRFRTDWARYIPGEHSAPETTDWWRMLSASGCSTDERVAACASWLKGLGWPPGSYDVVLLQVGRKKPYSQHPYRHNDDRPATSRSGGSSGRSIDFSGRRADWPTPVSATAAEESQAVQSAAPNDLRSAPAVARQSPGLPDFPEEGSAETIAEDDTHVAATRQRVADMLTIDIPLGWSDGTLPGSAPVAIFSPILAAAQTFADLDITRQTITLSLLCCPGLYLHPRALEKIVIHHSGSDYSMLPADAHPLDLDAGTLYCRIDEALANALAQESPFPTGGSDSQRPLWPLILPSALVGLWRIHLDRVRSSGIVVEDGSPALYLQPSTGLPPRAFTEHDLDLYLGNCKLVGHSLQAAHLLNFAESLTYRMDSRICPGVLPHLSGTYHPRYAAVVPYQRPLHSTRRDAAQLLFSSVVDEFVARFEAAPPYYDAPPHLGERLRSWLEEGVQAGRVITVTPDPDARSGSSTVPSLPALARAWRGACDRLAAAESGIERHALTILADICLGLRRDELRHCRPNDLAIDSDHNLWLRVARKGGGNGDRRWAHAPITGVLAELLIQIRDDEGANGLELLFPTDVDDPGAVSRRSRHVLSTFVLDQYAALDWSPRDWILFQALLGHELHGFPVFRDDDATHAASHPLWSALIGRFIRTLEETANDGQAD